MALGESQFFLRLHVLSSRRKGVHLNRSESLTFRQCCKMTLQWENIAKKWTDTMNPISVRNTWETCGKQRISHIPIVLPPFALYFPCFCWPFTSDGVSKPPRHQYCACIVATWDTPENHRFTHEVWGFPVNISFKPIYFDCELSLGLQKNLWWLGYPMNFRSITMEKDWTNDVTQPWDL